MSNIELINHDGQVIGSKPIAALTPEDIFHSVFIILVTPERQLILSRVGKKLSATAVTICTAGETPAEAATRAVKPLSPAEINLHHLGDQFYTAPDGRKIYMSVFYGQTPANSPKNCILITGNDLATRIAECTPALRFALQSYQHLLPA